MKRLSMVLFVRLAVCVMLLFGVVSIRASQTTPRSIKDGVYSAAQAERGAKVFTARCAGCHQREDFTGTFLAGWKAQTLDSLFETIRGGMPQDNPGGLNPKEYADILAFILNSNAFPPGPDDLPSTAAALKPLVIEEPGARKP